MELRLSSALRWSNFHFLRKIWTLVTLCQGPTMQNHVEDIFTCCIGACLSSCQKCVFFSNSKDLIFWMKSDHHQRFFCPCTSRSNHAKPGWRHLHSLKNMQFSKHLKFLIVCDHHQRFFCPCSLVSGVFRVIGCSRPWRPPTNYGQKIGHPEPLFVILKPLNSNYGH